MMQNIDNQLAFPYDRSLFTLLLQQESTHQLTSPRRIKQRAFWHNTLVAYGKIHSLRVFSARLSQRKSWADVKSGKTYSRGL